jgi:hypothetical protein
MKSVIICLLSAILTALATADSIRHPDLSFYLGWATLLGAATGIAIIGAVAGGFVFLTGLACRFPLIVCSVSALVFFEAGLFYGWKMIQYDYPKALRSSLPHVR